MIKFCFKYFNTVLQEIPDYRYVSPKLMKYNCIRDSHFSFSRHVWQISIFQMGSSQGIAYYLTEDRLYKIDSCGPTIDPCGTLYT